MAMRMLVVCGLLSAAILFSVSSAHAQPQRQLKTETRTGTIQEVRQKGRARTLVVTSDGEELTFPISPKVVVEVKLTGGDHSLLQKGAFLQGEGIVTNNRLFLEKGSVRLPSPGMKITESKIEKPEMLEPGQSLNLQLISGLILNRGTSMEYPDYEVLVLKPAPNIPQVMFQKDLTLDVISGDITDAEPGQEVELEVSSGRSDKLMLHRVTVEGGAYTPPESKGNKKE